MNSHHSCGLVVWMALCSAPLLAMSMSDMYTYTDERGVIHITNAPNDSRYVPMQQAEHPSKKTSVRGRYNHSSASIRSAPVRHYSARYDRHIQQAAQTYQLDADLVHAVIATESGYNARARSPKGAMGLMQLMPETARRYGVKRPYDPIQNIRGGTHYLRDLLHRYDNNLELALAAYNAGEGAVDRYGNTIPPYRETQDYVPRVIDYYNWRNQ